MTDKNDDTPRGATHTVFSPKRPSYLDHDPTKHGKLTKRPNNHRYARTKR